MKRRELRTANIDNLIPIDVDNKNTRNFHLALVNARSVKNKVEEIIQTFISSSIDVLIITESWLSDSIDDEVWLETQQFAKQGIKYHSVPRTTGK